MDSTPDFTPLIKVISGSPPETLSLELRQELLYRGIIDVLQIDGSANAVEAIFAAAIDQSIPGVRQSALQALQRLADAGNGYALDSVYQLALEHDLPVARQWIETRSWQPTRPALRALFDYFGPAGQFKTLEKLDLLACACTEEASPALCARILASAPSKGLENWSLIVSAGLSTSTSAEITRIVNHYSAFSEIERKLALNRLTAIAGGSSPIAPAAASAITQIFIEYEDLNARQIALANDLRPQDPYQQALFLFLAEDWPTYNTLDFDHTLLVSAYETGSRALKRRMLEHARRTGQIDWLRDVSASGNLRWPSDLTDADWDMAARRLASEGKWSDLWRLVQVAPPVWVVQILEHLTGAGWLPSQEEDRPFFAALASLARECLLIPMALHPRKTLFAPHGSLNCLAIRPDGALIAAGSSEQPIYTWNLPDGLLRFPPISGPAPTIRALAFSPDGSLLAAAAGDHRIRIFRMQDGAVLKSLEGHRALIRALAMHPDGRLLASAGFDGTIRLWRFPHGASLKTIQPTSSATGAEIFALVTGATAGGAAYLISAGADRLVSIWSLPDGLLLRQMSGHADTITNLATSPGSDLVASAGRDGLIHIWNYTSGGLVRVLEAAGGPLTALCLHPTDQVLLGAISRPASQANSQVQIEILVWNLSTGRIIARHPGSQASDSTVKNAHTQPISAMSISPDGDDFYSCDSGGRLLAWDLRTLLTTRLAVEARRPGAAANLLERVKNSNLTPVERKWLAFSAELARFRQRFDIELADFATIPVGEFDIEL